MTDQAAGPAPPAGPANETLGERVSDLFRRDAPEAIQVLGADAAAALRGHSSALIHVAASILAEDWPGGEQAASKVLQIALSVARTAGIAL